jgi:signal transduction histidine kinase
MDRERVVAPSTSLYPAIRRFLRQCVAETLAEMAFFAVQTSQGRDRRFAVIASWPHGVRNTPKVIQWVRQALSDAVDSGRVALAVGRWRTAPECPPRPLRLVVAPAFTSDGESWGALAVAVPSGLRGAKSEVVKSAQRCARDITNVAPKLDTLSAQLAPTIPASPAGAQPVVGPHTDILLHELRVPLGAANYALEALVQRRSSQWERADEELLNTARLGVMEAQSVMRSASQLLAIDNGLTNPDLRTISLGAALQRALALLPIACSRVSLTLDQEAPLVVADEMWLTQTFTNLLENALKYSESRSPITVVAGQAHDQVLMSIHSHSRDVPAGQHSCAAPSGETLSADDLTSKGLGLNIARRLIRGMGGELWIESEGSGDTTAIVALPIAYA